MLLPGQYIAEKTDNPLDNYCITMDVKETDKSYIFTLVDFQTRYGGAHIEMLFSKTKRVVIRKNKGGHAMRVWNDKSFTFYPYQAGIPYLFEKTD